MIKHRHHRLHTFITENSFTPHQSLKEVITNPSSSRNKVGLKTSHTQFKLHASSMIKPNKSITEDREGDHAHDLLIVHSRMMTISIVALINNIICNKGK